MSISQSSNPTSETNDLSYARQLLSNSHVDDCLRQGKSHVVRLVQGAWFLHQTNEPANYYRAYRDILRFLQAQPECQS